MNRTWAILGLVIGSCAPACMIEEYVEEEDPVRCDSVYCRVPCETGGQCLPQVMGDGSCSCVANWEELCWESHNCYSDGHCSVVGDECQLTGYWDCERTWGCESECAFDFYDQGCGFNGVTCVDTCT